MTARKAAAEAGGAVSPPNNERVRPCARVCAKGDGMSDTATLAPTGQMNRRDRRHLADELRNPDKVFDPGRFGQAHERLQADAEPH